MKEINRHTYCPVCGHQLTGQFDYQNITRKLLLERTPYTIKRIKDVFIQIQKYQKEEITAFSSYRFLKRLAPIQDNIIKHVINQYLGGEYHKKQYGLSYLIAWIEGADKTKDGTIRAEKARFGSSPPTRIIEAEKKVVRIMAHNINCSSTPALDKLKKQQGIFNE